MAGLYSADSQEAKKPRKCKQVQGQEISRSANQGMSSPTPVTKPALPSSLRKNHTTIIQFHLFYDGSPIVFTGHEILLMLNKETITHPEQTKRVALTHRSAASTICALSIRINSAGASETK